MFDLTGKTALVAGGGGLEGAVRLEAPSLRPAAKT
ncbi:hypothetical protein LCGC14_1055350 [marine sediment metagenome]|uniref:Uncharacterized protein n=1 Tax=marine sediment metagenome TaxID=412755 RepID=A0A0F9QTN3_9ZZZZ